MAPRIYTVGSSTRTAAEFLEVLTASSPTAILCAERLPWRCHRRFLASALWLRGWEVIHIVERDRTLAHAGGQEGEGEPLFESGRRAFASNPQKACAARDLPRRRDP